MSAGSTVRSPRRCRGAAIRHRAGRRTALQRLAARGGERVLAAGDRRIERPVRPAGQRDQPGGFAVEPIEPDVRALLRLGFEIGARAQPHQAAVALLPRREQHDARQMFAGAAPPGPHRFSWSPKSIASAQPMIGWMPEPAIFSENSSAPNMLSVSVSANAGWRSFFASSASRTIGQRALKQRVGRMDVQMDKTRHGRASFKPVSHGPIVRCALRWNRRMSEPAIFWHWRAWRIASAAVHHRGPGGEDRAQKLYSQAGTRCAPSL